MAGPEEWLSTTEPGLPASFTFPALKLHLAKPSLVDDACSANCLIFKHNYLRRYFQYAQYPFVFIGLFQDKKIIKTDVNKSP